MYVKKKSERPARWCCFMIAVMLFAGGLESTACNAAGNQPEVLVGSELEFPPYAFVDESGRPAGFSVELIKAVADAMGLSLKISTDSWGTLWNALVAGRLDVLPIVAKTPERQRLVDFSLPHTKTYDAFFVRKGDLPIQNIEAARGKEIVVMRSDAAHHELLERNFQGNLILVDTITAGLLLISSGKHNAFLCSKLIGTLLIKKHGLRNLSAGLPIPDYKRVFSFGVKKGDTELLEKLNQGLLIVKTNGEYDRIYVKWLTFDDPWRKVKKYLLPAFIMGIAIALIVGFWIVMLQGQIKRRTRELAGKNEMLGHVQDNLETRVQERTAELAQSSQSLLSEITERKRAEKALRESEEKYRLLVEHAGEAIFVAQDGRLKFVNQTSSKLTGYTREEMTSRPFIEFIHTDDRELVLDRHFKRQEGMELPPIYSFRIITQSGDTRWVNLNAVQIEWEGKPATLNFMFDITDLKQAEESLRLSDEKLSKAFRASPDWMTISTLEEGRYVDVNDAFVEFSGFSREGVLGKTLIELGLWMDPHERDRAVEIIRKEGFFKNFESKIRIKSGEVRTMLWSAEAFDLKGRKYVIDTNRDITELRKAQENLEQALENLRRALGGTIEALAMTSEARDPYTAGHQRRVANLARAIGQEMGLPEDKVNGLRMAGAIHDLGKISIPAEILSKPTKLSDMEFSLIKDHPQVGYEVLKDIEFPWPIARIVLEHHERMNGSGYPNGLTGDQLLLESKILIVADLVEAMASHRPYRPALGVDAALEEIEQNKGTLYDPEVVDACLRLFREKGFGFELFSDLRMRTVKEKHKNFGLAILDCD